MFVPRRVNGQRREINRKKNRFYCCHPSYGYPARWLDFTVFLIGAWRDLQLRPVREHDYRRLQIQVSALLVRNALSNELHFADSRSSAGDYNGFALLYVLSDAEVHDLALSCCCRRERVEQDELNWLAFRQNSGSGRGRRR